MQVILSKENMTVYEKVFRLAHISFILYFRIDFMEWEPRKYICHQHISNVFDFWRQKRYFDILVVRANLCALSFSVDITWSESKKKKLWTETESRLVIIFSSPFCIFVSTYYILLSIVIWKSKGKSDDTVLVQ